MTFSKLQIAAITLAVLAQVGLVVGGGIVVWEKVGPGAWNDFDPYYEPPGTSDPALIALGDRFLAGVPTPAGAQRAGPECGVIDVSLCLTSDRLSPRALLDATVEEMAAAGATVERRWCFIDQCLAYLDYRGAPLLLVGDDQTGLTPRPTVITGGVATERDPYTEF